MSDLRMELMQGQLNDIEESVRSIKATWGNTIMTLDNIKSSLKANRQKAVEEAYQKGLNDMHKAIQKISNMSAEEKEAVFYGQTLYYAINEYTTNGIMEKLAAYEKQQKADEIKVGDEVKNTLGLMDNAVGYFFGDSSDGCYKVLRYVDGKFKTGIWNKGNCERTGKHSYAVERMVAVMKGEHRYCSSCEYSSDPDGIRCEDCCGHDKWEPKGEQRNCHTCKHQLVNSINCVDCYGYEKWEPKEGAE